MPPLQLRMAITPLCHQKRSRNDSLTQINREESSTSVSSYIQPKLVPQEGKTKPSSNNTKIALSSYKTQRKIKYDMTRKNIECITGRSCLRLSKLKKRQGALSKQLFSPEANHWLCKGNLDYYTKIALHKSFCIFCGHFLNTYPLDSNLSFGQPRPEILHIASVVF